MAALALQILGIARGWREAWNTIGDNPLVKYWGIAEYRRNSAKPWWKRSPGILALAVILSAFTTYSILLLIQRITHAPGGYITPLEASCNIATATSLLLLCSYLFVMIWLLARFGTISITALGFLEIQPRQTIRQTLDDLLVVTKLSEQDVILGLGVHCFRLVFQPLVMLSFLCFAQLAFQAFHDGDVSPHGVLFKLMLGLAISVGLLIGGCLASWLLTFMLASLSLAPRSGWTPSLGTASQIFMQAGIGLIGIFLLIASLYPNSYYGNLAQYSINVGFIFIFGIGLLFYLARRSAWIKATLANAFPVVLLGCSMLPFIILVNCFGSTAYLDMPYLNLAWVVQSFCLANPILVFLTFARDSFPGENFSEFTSWWRVCALILFQVAMVIMFAEFARDAIKRRKWNQGGA